MNKDDHIVLYAISAFAFLILIGTLTYSHLEGWTLTKSLYFTISTLSTVGYGSPGLSEENRLFTAFFIMIFATLALACIAAIGNWIISKLQYRKASHHIHDEALRIRAAIEKLGHSDEELHENISKIGEDALDSMRKG